MFKGHVSFREGKNIYIYICYMYICVVFIMYPNYV